MRLKNEACRSNLMLTERFGPRAENIPNLLSLSRAVLAVIAYWTMLQGNYRLALALFLGGLVTDALDGHIARRFGWTSGFGRKLDKLVDIPSLLLFIVLLNATGRVPWFGWLLLAPFVIGAIGALVVMVQLGRDRLVEGYLMGRYRPRQLTAIALYVYVPLMLAGIMPYEITVFALGFQTALYVLIYRHEYLEFYGDGA